MGRLMRRQESRRGAMVTGEADCQDRSPEMTALEEVDGFKTPVDNNKHDDRWQAVFVLPGVGGRIEPDIKSVW